MANEYEAERVGQLRDFLPDEITAILSAEGARQLDGFQVTGFEEGDLTGPIEQVLLVEPDLHDLFTNNTAMFDDDIEDVMADDFWLNHLVKERATRPSDEALTMAIRTRRTILFLLITSED